MKLGKAVLAALLVGSLCLALPAGAATVTSSFVNFVYSYSVTPAPGEMVMDFHIYAGVNECNIAHYYNVVMPPGWNFTLTPLADKCVITWWTTSNPLPVGIPAQFGYTHYCAPCCHTWFLTSAGTPDPGAPPIDASWNHSEPCNIPPEFGMECHGAGAVVAPIYPDPTPTANSTWGGIKVLYR
jgi:hypothetical protein